MIAGDSVQRVNQIAWVTAAGQSSQSSRRYSHVGWAADHETASAILGSACGKHGRRRVIKTRPVSSLPPGRSAQFNNNHVSLHYCHGPESNPQASRGPRGLLAHSSARRSCTGQQACKVANSCCPKVTTNKGPSTEGLLGFGQPLPTPGTRPKPC